MKVGYYIVSKGRPKRQHTAALLHASKLPFKIFVEPQDYEAYCSEFGKRKIVNIKENDGGIHWVRNFVKEYSKSRGEDYHWHLDDDIRHVYICVKGKNMETTARTVFGRIQKIVAQYQNVALAGLAASAFNRYEKHPVVPNRFVYSCMLVKNDQFLWRAETEDDLDYNLQVLTAGQCTMAFKVFSFAFSPQNTISGGLTEIRTPQRREQWVYQILRDWSYLGLKMKRKKDGTPRVVTSGIWRKFNHKPQWI